MVLRTGEGKRMSFDGQDIAQFFQAHVDQSIWLGAALGGRLMYVLQEVKRGARRLLSIKTVIDMAMAGPLAMITNGLCDHYGASGSFKASIIGVAGYLGPRVIDMVVDVWKTTRTAKQEAKSDE